MPMLHARPIKSEYLRVEAAFLLFKDPREIAAGGYVKEPLQKSCIVSMLLLALTVSLPGPSELRCAHLLIRELISGH